MMNLVDAERHIRELSQRIDVLKRSIDDHPARLARPIEGGGRLYGVIREVEAPDDPYVLVTRGVLLDSDTSGPWFQLPENTVEPYRTEPGTFGRNYTQWVWEGLNETFPKDWEAGMYVVPLTLCEGRWIVEHHSRLWFPDPLPANLKHTDCYLVSGGGAQVEIIYA